MSGGEFKSLPLRKWVSQINNNKLKKNTEAKEADCLHMYCPCLTSRWRQTGCPVAGGALRSAAHLSPAAAPSYRQQPGKDRKLEGWRSSKSLNSADGKCKGFHSHVRVPAFLSSLKKTDISCLKTLDTWSKHR